MSVLKPNVNIPRNPKRKRVRNQIDDFVVKIEVLEDFFGESMRD